MSREGKRVLVAEDDDAARDMLGALLVQAGYNVHATNDGWEALEELQRRHFDVVITDCNMPHLDGREFLSLSQAAWPHLPVIMLSGERVDVSVALKQLGAYAWVTKPYDTWYLLEIIREAAYRTTENESSRLTSHVKEV